MNEKTVTDHFSESVEKARNVLDESSIDKNVTEEEFQNFMSLVTEVEKIVKKLASPDPEEQKHGEVLADEILQRKVQADFSEVGDLKVKTNRTVINKAALDSKSSDQNEMSKDAFVKSVEKDARERAENRKVRNERAETFKRTGNGAFKEGNYEKAVTYYSKAIEQRKDSSVLWNNRALSYMHLGLFEKAILDCEWALKVTDGNLKALLNIAKCYMNLGEETKYKEFIALARERNPHFNKFIDEFEESVKAQK